MFLNSPRNIAFFNALVISLIAGIVLVIIYFFITKFSLLIIPAVIITVFLLAFALINFSINKFFHEKINVIYRTIGELNVPREKSLEKKETNDVLDIVNQVVLRWSKEKKKEIEELKKMAVYRREFLGNVSHELKTPVFNIQGYVDTLLDGGLEDESINVKFLQKTQKSVNRMIALVQDLEEISKLESANLKLKQETFNLYELVLEVVDFMEEKAKNNNCNIVLSSNMKMIKVVADKKRIRQVFINLIENAIKYGNPSDPWIKISFFNFHESYLVEITDNGIGIPESSISRIFERFYRTDESRSRDKGGTGLGLAIVKHIIEAHQQTISVRSNPGEGTTFSFTLNRA
jgi:two-component system phosphate regulon sensor histidine kinase PhoR